MTTPNVESEKDHADTETGMMEDTAVGDMMTASSVSASLTTRMQDLLQIFMMMMRQL